jgi:hypothetical protein
MLRRALSADFFVLWPPLLRGVAPLSTPGFSVQIYTFSNRSPRFGTICGQARFAYFIFSIPTD